MAYFVLPTGAHEHFDKFEAIFAEMKEAAGAYFYFATCKAHNMEGNQEHANQFHAYRGNLGPAREYFAIEYPKPPPLSMTDADFTKLTPGNLPTLAPYFSVAVRERQSGDVKYFVLGQSLTGGTTLRSVTPQMNGNLGDGPEPKLEHFLARLRKLLG